MKYVASSRYNGPTASAIFDEDQSLPVAREIINQETAASWRCLTGTPVQAVCRFRQGQIVRMNACHWSMDGESGSWRITRVRTLLGRLSSKQDMSITAFQSTLSLVPVSVKERGAANCSRPLSPVLVRVLVKGNNCRV